MSASFVGPSVRIGGLSVQGSRSARNVRMAAKGDVILEVKDLKAKVRREGQRNGPERGLLGDSDPFIRPFSPYL